MPSCSRPFRLRFTLSIHFVVIHLSLFLVLSSSWSGLSSLTERPPCMLLCVAYRPTDTVDYKLYWCPVVFFVAFTDVMPTGSLTKCTSILEFGWEHFVALLEMKRISRNVPLGAVEIKEESVSVRLATANHTAVIIVYSMSCATRVCLTLSWTEQTTDKR